MTNTLLAITLLLTGSAPATSDVCPKPDGLDGPCCAEVTPNLPQFPALTVLGSALCYDTCVPTPKTCTSMALAIPQSTACSEYTLDLGVTDCVDGAQILSGQLILDYARTWKETQVGPEGGLQEIQVWRFLAKGDLSGVADDAENCPVPSCLLAYDGAFYYGYLDYVRNCVTGKFEAAAVLFHAGDHFVHSPVLSDRPGAFHPTHSYALVMPDTSANPFLPGITPAPSGILTEEAMRTIRTASGAEVCTAEEDLSQGQLLALGNACLCPFGFMAAQVTASAMSGTGSCPDPAGIPSRFKSLNLFGLVPWYELMSHSIGRWSTDACYPGQEEVWVSEGLFNYHDSCATIPGVATGNSIEIHYGASTRGGFLAQEVGEEGLVLPSVFLDLASNFSHQTGTGVGIQPPILGSVRTTNHLIYVNVD